MLRTSWTVVLVLVTTLTTGAAPGAAAAEPAVVTAGAPAARAGEPTTVTVAVSVAGAPVDDASVLVERREDGVWRTVADLVTDPDGGTTTDVVVRRAPRDNVVRVSTPATDQHDGARTRFRLGLIRRESRITLRGPDAFVDETAATLTIHWRAVGAGPVAGRVELLRRNPGQRHWRRHARVRTGPDGEAVVEVSPRVDTRWRVVTPSLPWLRRSRSDTHRLDNLPPAPPVALPAGAPRPRRSLPPQQRAVGSGPNARITRIPDVVWRQMTGRSWHPGCPVGRAGLRLIRINYWDYTGYRRRGELVVAASVARQVGGAFRDLYAAELPVRAMYRVDRFGWSPRVQGADDYASMAAGNTSAFNCRNVVGRPGVRSPHAYGRAIDLNPWENPYRSPQGVYPNTWWLGHSHPRVAWRSRTHRVVQIMARHGVRWTYGHTDLQHFDAVPRNGRLLRVRGCGEMACH